jgi:hypothetical protein
VSRWVPMQVGAVPSFEVRSRLSNIPTGRDKSGGKWYPAIWAGQLPYVGLDPNDPGAGWGQAPTPQEQAQGYKKTDVLTLQENALSLKNQVDGVIQYMDPSTDAGCQASIKKLQANVNQLVAGIAEVLAGHITYQNNYPGLLIKYNGLAAELASYGLTDITPTEPAAPAPGGGGQKPAPGPGKVVQAPATPDAPVIKTQEPTKSNTVPWLLLLGAGLLGALSIFFSWKASR